MQYWYSVMNEVLHKPRSHAFLSDPPALPDDFDTEKEIRDLRTYYLGDKFPNVYLTKREAETMFWLMQSDTIGAASAKMGLSARTVEFYVKNLKLKLRCKNKKTLVHKVLQTTLLQQLEKEGMRLVKH